MVTDPLSRRLGQWFWTDETPNIKAGGFRYNFVLSHRQAIETESHSGHRYEPVLRQAVRGLRAEGVRPGIFPGYTAGRWWYRGEEIDLVAVRESDASIAFGECKWGSLTEREARGVLTQLVQKAGHVRADRCPNECFCLITGGVAGKDRLRDEGSLVYDLTDIEAACSIG